MRVQTISTAHLVLAQQEGQQHQHASVVDDPPDVDVALGEALPVGWVAGDVLRNQQRQTCDGRLSHHLWKEKTELTVMKECILDYVLSMRERGDGPSFETQMCICILVPKDVLLKPGETILLCCVI